MCSYMYALGDMPYGEGRGGDCFEVKGEDKKSEPNSHQVSRAARRLTLVIHFSIQNRKFDDFGTD